jgi:hypothetical protein
MPSDRGILQYRYSALYNEKGRLVFETAFFIIQCYSLQNGHLSDERLVHGVQLIIVRS